MTTLLVAVSICALAGAAAAEPAWTPPRNAFGQPDLEGAWSNATITPQARPARFGSRLVMTPQEVRAAEGAADAQIERGNQATDPSAPVVEDGRVGGYNRGRVAGSEDAPVKSRAPRGRYATTPSIATASSRGPRKVGLKR